MKSVRIVNVPGYRKGEIKSFPDNKAITYCQNGQAEPVGWTPEKHGAREEPKVGQPMNRMLDTGSEKVKAKRQKDTD